MRSDRGLPPGARREGVWPRIYRPTRAYRMFLGGLGVIAVVGGSALAALVLRDPKAPVGLGIALGAGFSALGAFLLGAVLRERVALFEDGTAEFSELGRGRTRLRPAEIEGTRSLRHQGVTYVFFHFREQGRKPFRAGLICERDEHFDRWLAAFPDLDVAERAIAEAALAADATLGEGPEERTRALSRARLLTRTLTAAGWAVVAWGWFRPRPYAAAVVALATVPALAIALLLARRGVVALDERKTDPRPSVLVPILMPGLVLMLRALLDVHVIDGGRLVALAAPPSVAVAALLATGDPKLPRRWFLPFLVLFIAAPLCWGIVAHANVLLDASRPELHRARITGKRVSSGKVTTWNVTLAPFGTLPGGEEADVGREAWERMEVGGDACVALHRGRLGARWLTVQPCE